MQVMHNLASFRFNFRAKELFERPEMDSCQGELDMRITLKRLISLMG